MSRSVEEWIGKDDDEPVPRRVRVRVFTLADGQCAICRRKLRPGDKWTCDHALALINGGQNRESNLQVLCEWCDKPKTVFDVQTKSKTARRRANHLGIKCKRSSFATNKDQPWKKRMDGSVVRRDVT